MGLPATRVTVVAAVAADAETAIAIEAVKLLSNVACVLSALHWIVQTSYYKLLISLVNINRPILKKVIRRI